MGYDITAYAAKSPPADPTALFADDDELAWKVSFLEMGAGSSDASPLFEVLDAREHDGGVSGTGIGRYFTREQVVLALRKLCRAYADGGASERTVRFLAETAERTSGREWVYIGFY